ncbi:MULTISPECIES: thiolase family protein [Marinobacter]|jgi:acetyl-CoA C-acetyltransferase|uniref:Acetyl-CoA C-acetyltransferase n=1 Tax=Marinobacter salarius TaxID=1420917 RepID=W5YSV8_9GAMM|nr:MULTISPECIES: acetyl-CoA C-acyltransferase [Marinobacter]AHI31944.1 acetyl-CoA acetyltransferase [Marinobacter salarius]ARM85849.1 acetyl-CoA acetyltransferase [Marinobacter salarius]AZR40702.1 acetyl-CoA C-acetyltransferase [Marinobacter salarius]KXJ46983.1 MAG: acetyl-CoA acetyltransferase [Marinobacter sp. Hex_13]MBS8232148.1 acetyl-CoA C-acyltransferase [Marinobacter salarius]
MNSNDVVIAGSARTPMGGMMGDLSSVRSPDLGAISIKAAIERSGLQPADIQEVIMGCVLPGGLGQAPARQASRASGIPDSSGCTTVNKMCGSGMQAVIMAHDQIKAGTNSIMIAGGMENMSQAPYLLPKARAGMRMGHGQVMDSMFLDGLEDAYEGGLMGVFAQRTADKYDISREAMDNFAIASLERSLSAIKNGGFSDEITPVTVSGRGGDTVVDTDEQPGKAKPEKIPHLKPAFAKDGSVTAANASSISDGASAMVLATREEAEKRGLTPQARIVAHATHARLPAEFTLAPIGAIEKVLKKAGWNRDDVDLFEINEAFAVVTLAAINELGLDADKVNVHGGACALGHPIGSSGSRIMVTLINALKQRGLKRGVASLCIGGGEGTAVAIELL